MVENARKALGMKTDAAKTGPDFNTRTAHDGMNPVVNRRAENLIRPMELGRQRKAAQVAQAKRDAR